MTVADDIQAIQRLLATYCQTVDSGRFDEWEQLWADDATFSVMGHTHTGRAALRAFIEAAQPPEARGKHVAANSIIDVDGDEATATSDFVFYAARDSGGFVVTQVGRYLDRFQRTPGGWRFAAREVVLGLG